MNILMVTSECAPFIKTGGLADVVGALPRALAKMDVSVKVLLPAYGPLRELAGQGTQVAEWNNLAGQAARLVAVSAQGLELLLLDAPQLFDRPGSPYLDENGQDWPDNHLRFGALAQAAAGVAFDGVGDWRPDLVHAHDWQAGLVPVYLKQDPRAAPKTVLTIHNIAFQGRFGAHVLDELGLRQDWFHPEALEYHGDLSFLKAGLVMADAITTVSPTYAREILTPNFGMGLEGVLQARRTDLSGILNGIDTEVWNPETDAELTETYSARSLTRKARNRDAIAGRMGLDASDGPLFCVISRLSDQKGLDALAGAVGHLVARGGQLVLLGSGAPELEQAFEAAAHAHPGQVGVHIGYDEGLSHLLQGGSDVILIPSRFEPCGLTQLYGLRYGTLPVVARTGGLADTVIDASPAALDAGCATGVQFDEVSASGICAAIDRVFDLYGDQKTWAAMQRNAMRQTVDWGRSAATYLALYRGATG